MNTPVLLIIYNRLDPVKKVLSKINEAGPTRVYIAGDGAKANNPSDSARVKEVRKYVLDHIDGETEVFTLFRKENLGVKYAVSEALRWFFSSEDRGIILEDDCLPSDRFFTYCGELLEMYEDDKRIGMITGRNELGTYENNLDGDYFLSTRGFVWGWATWRDRIEYLDIEIAEKITPKHIFLLFKNSSSILEFAYRMKTMKDLNNHFVDTWDYQWSVCLLLHSKYTLIPKKNMVKNIGFGKGSTHTFGYDTDSVDHFEENDRVKHPQVLRDEKLFTYKTVRKETGGLLRVLVPGFLVKLVRRFK